MGRVHMQLTLPCHGTSPKRRGQSQSKAMLEATHVGIDRGWERGPREELAKKRAHPALQAGRRVRLADER